MFEPSTIKHHIGRSIVSHLKTHEFARFSEMRPKNVDTNLFTYHLKQLIAAGMVVRCSGGYTLGEKGLLYVDRASDENMKLRTQPKIITMLLIQNSSDEILLQQRQKQPYIGQWTLPYGKLHIDDDSVLTAATREAEEKLGFMPTGLRHIGDCYIVTLQTIDSEPVQSRTLVHLARFETDAIAESKSLRWVEPFSLASLPLAPAVEQIVTKASTTDSFFFEEFRVPVQ